MKLIIQIVFFSLNITACYAQVFALKAQESIANKFINCLEGKDINDAILLFNIKEVNDSITLRRKLTVAAKEIEGIRNKTFPLIMLIKSKNENIYRCRYINEKERYSEFYQIDVIFAKTDIKKINRVEYRDRKTLIQEQIKREKSENEVPPAPPIIKQ